MLRLRKRDLVQSGKLTGSRRDCYAVHPPTVRCPSKRLSAILINTYIGVCVLNAWHNGKYYSGMELDLKEGRAGREL